MTSTIDHPGNDRPRADGRSLCFTSTKSPLTLRWRVRHETARSGFIAWCDPFALPILRLKIFFCRWAKSRLSLMAFYEQGRRSMSFDHGWQARRACHARVRTSAWKASGICGQIQATGVQAHHGCWCSAFHRAPTRLLPRHREPSTA